MLKMPGESYSGAFLPLSTEELESQQQLKQHIYALSEAIGERNIYCYAGLQRAANYIASNFQDLGYKINNYSYQLKGLRTVNIEAEIVGYSKPNEIIVIGAHYDSVQGSPGANDNASGVAAILELARLFKANKPKRTLRFVAFPNEEPPFFYSRKMGSYHYAKQCRKSKENIIAMLSIETIGYYSDKQRSQLYPFPFMYFYPNVGNFISFVSDLSSKALLLQAITAFRNNCKFPSEGAYLPGWITGVAWSDQWAFWRNK